MKAFQIRGEWSLAALQLVDLPEPQAGPGEVKLRMLGAALNYRDLLVPLRGYGRFTGELPLIPLTDGVGEVVAVGAGVTRVMVGDRVIPLTHQRWFDGPLRNEHAWDALGGPLDGTMAEFRVFHEEGVSKVPVHLSDAEAAATPCAGITAWSALVTEGRVAAGDTVLIQGTGGVALFALQFAKMHGARAIVISSSDAKLARARALGADECINYVAEPQWGRKAAAIAGGEGVDHVIELGGQSTLEQSLRAVRPHGTLSLIGVLGGTRLDAPLGQVVTRFVRLQGITGGHRSATEAMLRAMGQHRMHPVVDRVFPFERLHEALEHLRSGAHFGKICLASPAS